MAKNEQAKFRGLKELLILLSLAVVCASGSLQCKFFPGFVRGNREQIGNTGSEGECASLVTSKRPEANGATWNQDRNTCMASFGSSIYTDNDGDRACLFNATCQYYQEIDYDTDYHGNDIISFENAFKTNTWDECSGKCSGYSQCAAWTWLEWNNKCLVKTARQNVGAASQHISGSRRCY